MSRRLTDHEKRVFLSAMQKEWKMCEEFDKKNESNKEAVPMVPIVDSIIQKVINSNLWKER